MVFYLGKLRRSLQVVALARALLRGWNSLDGTSIMILLHGLPWKMLCRNATRLQKRVLALRMRSREYSLSHWQCGGHFASVSVNIST
jgi:hypothetical protein